jgi:hypothetical protein
MHVRHARKNVAALIGKVQRVVIHAWWRVGGFAICGFACSCGDAWMQQSSVVIYLL